MQSQGHITFGRVVGVRIGMDNNKGAWKYYISLRLNPTTGFNPIVGFTSNYWMQKHPIVGCNNLYKTIAHRRSHWEVAPYV